MKKYYYDNKYIFIYSILALCIIFFLYYIFYLKNKNDYFYINEFSKKYFIIPSDRQGEKIKYLNKKLFNSEDKNIILNENNSIKNINYTIQIYVDTNYDSIANYLDKILLNNNKLIRNDFKIFSLNTNISVYYYLVYMNFENSDEAMNICKKLILIEECIILNLK